MRIFNSVVIFVFFSFLLSCDDRDQQVQKLEKAPTRTPREKSPVSGSIPLTRDERNVAENFHEKILSKNADQLVDFLGELSENSDKDGVLQKKLEIFSRLAKVDPYLGYQELLKIGSGSDRQAAISQFFGNISEPVFLTEFDSEKLFPEDIPLIRASSRSLFFNLADSDFEKIEVSMLPDFLKETYWSSFGAKHFDQRLGDLNLQPISSDYRQTVIESWIGYKARENPEIIAKEFDQLGIPSDYRENSAILIASNFAKKNPSAASVWALELGESSALRTAILVWSSRDLSEAADWVATLPPSELRDAASFTVIEKLTKLDDGKSARAWFETMGESEWKGSAASLLE